MKNFRYYLLLSFLGTAFISNAQYSKTEEKIGKATYEMVKNTTGFYQNDALLNVVKEIGEQLEKQLDQDYHFKYYLMDTPDLNAFATAGGYVYVTRGLLAIVNTRDELAGILAHEFQHVANRHVPKKIMANLVPGILELPANIIGMLTYKEFADVINFPIAESSKLAISAYSRSQEMEADKKGIDIAIKAGYNPYGLPLALQHLTEFIEFKSGEPMKKNIFIDHPMTDERVKYLSSIINEKGLEGKAPVFEGTKVPELEDLIYGQNPVAGMIRDNVFVHPDINFYCEFPGKWPIQNSPLSVTSISPDKKSTLIISIDTTAKTPREAAAKTLKKLQNSDVLSVDSSDVHEFQAYKVTFRHRRLKYKDYLSEVLWLKLPGSHYLLKVVGISTFSNPEKLIAQSMNTFRMLTNDDLKNFSLKRITLKKIGLYDRFETYLDGYLPVQADQEFILKLNTITPDQKISSEDYLKFIDELAIRK
jgi:predicted Zn-dependent protease